MTTKTKQDLQQMAEAICAVQSEIKKKEKLLATLKSALYPFMTPGEAVTCPQGRVIMREGKNSLVFTSKAAEKKIQEFKENMIQSGEAFNKKGEAYLEINVGKECI